MMPSKPLRLGLFAKVMIAFVVLIIVGAVLTIWLARRATAEEFVVFTSEMNQQQAGALAPVLADYYRENGSWAGVQAVLETPLTSMMGPGSGMGMGSMMGNRRGPGQGQGQGPGPMAGMSIWQMVGSRVLLADQGGQILADTAGELVGAQLDQEALTAGVPIHVGDRAAGTVLVTAGILSADQNTNFLDEVGRAILLSALTAGIVAFVFGGLILWQVIRPLRQLTGAAQAIAEGELAQQVNVTSRDEIGDLAAAFNQMSDRLARSELLRRQMTADIAHELRTPLAVIQGNVEALQDGIFPLTIGALAPIQDKTDLLYRLVEDLRQLTLAESGQLPLDRQPVDFSTLAAKIVESFLASAEAKGIMLSFKAQASLPPVDIDAQRMEQVLGNLVANALQYTPEDGQVIVDLVQTGDDLLISVQDSGPGIPPEALPNVFERFYRVDQSRTRDRDGGGSGLGLAVAQSIVQAHGGRIGVDSQMGQGARFWFTVPID